MYHAASGSAFSAFLALGLTCASVATLFVVVIVVMLLEVDLTVAVALGQLGLVVIPLVTMRATGRDVRALGLRRPQLRFVVAATLVGTSTWYLNMRIVELLPFEPGDARVLVQLVDRPSLVVVLICIAVVPAVCEEILFRGVLLRGLASQLHAWVAVFASAIAFSLYHVNPIQMLPTFTLGLAFGLIAQRGASAIPTMIAHALNNCIALLVARGELPFLANASETGVLDRYPAPALAGAAIVTATGVALAFTGPAVDQPGRG